MKDHTHSGSTALRVARALISIPAIAFTVLAVEVAPALAAGGNTGTGGGGGGSVINPGNGSAPPGNSSADITKLVDWIAWIVFACCIVGVLYSAGTLAFERQGFGGGGQGHTRLIWALAGCIVAGSASALVGALA